MNRPTPPRTHRRGVKLRFMTCRECGLDWNVSSKTVTPKNGYLCPSCWGKQRSTGSNKRSTKQ